MAFIIAQIMGILGMAMNIVSYQAKSKRNIISIQFFGSLFFTINMFMLNAFTGALLNLIGVIRAIIYANKEKIKNIKPINFAFVFTYLASYVLTFAVFGKEFILFNIIIEILPVIAMIATTISFSKDSAKTVRKFAFISSPSWLIYNCFNLAIGGILCEIFTLISTVIGIIRFDKKQV
jgi:hypothetical protein